MKPIRRTDRAISLAEAKTILAAAEYGVLSTVDSDGQPYGMPLNFVYRNDAIYFHCATSGQKLDNIAYNAKVSFCAVGKTKVLPEKFATEYESVIAFGVASEVTASERLDALVWLLEKYCADYIEAGKQYIKQKDTMTKVIKIAVSQVSGKARR